MDTFTTAPPWPPWSVRARQRWRVPLCSSSQSWGSPCSGGNEVGGAFAPFCSLQALLLESELVLYWPKILQIYWLLFRKILSEPSICWASKRELCWLWLWTHWLILTVSHVAITEHRSLRRSWEGLWGLKIWHGRRSWREFQELPNPWAGRQKEPPLNQRKSESSFSDFIFYTFSSQMT